MTCFMESILANSSRAKSSSLGGAALYDVAGQGEGSAHKAKDSRLVANLSPERSQGLAYIWQGLGWIQFAQLLHLLRTASPSCQSWLLEIWQQMAHADAG